MAASMEWGIGVNRAEQAVDGAAAAMFAAAVGFGLWAVDSGIGIATVAAAAAFLAAKFGLGLIAPETRTYPMPTISPAAIDTIAEAPVSADDELILEDKLVEVSPDARVVRLFGPSQSHHSGHPGQAPPDASQALSEALAELRRSLR